MKTPLSHEILDNWQLPEAPKHRLTVSTLLEAQQAAGRRVGLLLDLSNHGGLVQALRRRVLQNTLVCVWACGTRGLQGCMQGCTSGVLRTQTQTPAVGNSRAGSLVTARRLPPWIDWRACVWL